MLYNARSDGDGAGTATINPVYLSLTTNARPGTHALDTTYLTSDQRSHVHNGRSSAATSSRLVDPYPTLYTGPDATYMRRTNNLPEARSAAQPPVPPEGETLHPSPRRSPASRDYYPDSWDLLHQSIYNPALLAYSGEDSSSAEQATRDMHAVPGPSWSSAYTYMDAEIGSAGAALWSGASLTSDYSSLQDALLSAPEGSLKKRKMHDLDPESDVEDVSGSGTSTSKKRKIQDTCPAPTPATTAEDDLELTAGPKRRSKRRSESEQRAVKAEGSKRIRNGHKDGIEALRQNQKLYPEAPKKKPTKAEVLRTALAYIESSMPMDEASQLRQRIEYLEQRNASLLHANLGLQQRSWADGDHDHRLSDDSFLPTAYSI